MDFNSLAKGIIEESEQSLFSIALWRTAKGFNCYVKGSEFEILGAAEYLAETMKAVIAQKVSNQQPQQRIVIPKPVMSS